MDPQKHPFYEHSDAEFFLAIENGEIVGRIAVMENKPFNKWHDTRKAQFYFFDSIDNQDVANALMERAFEWAKNRNLDVMIGPKGLSLFDGYGILIEGFELRQMMIMMNYNYSYYPKLMENLGFVKDVDFVSGHLDLKTFNLPEKVHEISRRVQERGTFKIKNFKNKKELKSWAQRIGEAYNKTFVDNWEYYPQTDAEIKFTLDDILLVAVPELIKIITHKDEVVGFLFGFPDISAALQRNRGRITPWGIVDMLIGLKRTKFISLNGVGILPEFQGRGGNALLYSEILKTMTDFGYAEAEITQMANTAVQVRRDLKTVGATEYKNHRVYTRKI
jgi:GNAT superfamily N-acetyltransferase